MNYKILAVSTVIGVGVIAVSLMEAQSPPPRKEVEQLTALEAPGNEFGFREARSNYPAPPRPSPEQMPRAMAPAIAPPPPPREPDRAMTVNPGSLAIPAADIPVGLPQIAYVFTYGFRIAGPNIPVLQQRHADLCESKGPLVCRIISMDHSGSDGEYASGTLQLAVASSEARGFGKQLATLAERADGEQFAAAISGEDLSKHIVDTEARLRARTVLRDRLMEVLATRRGSVTELVEAERGVAQVNEEIDQARSWLAEMKSRVAFSRLDIAYESGQPVAPTRGFMDPVRGAVGSLGPMFGVLTAILILLGALGLPGLAIWLGARALWRRSGWQWPATTEAAV